MHAFAWIIHPVSFVGHYRVTHVDSYRKATHDYAHKTARLKV